MTGEKFLVEIRIEVQKLDPQGNNFGREHLSIQETGQVNASTFAEVAGILGKFHELLVALRVSEQEKRR